MSDKMMKIAGKTNDSTVAGVKVTTEGNIEDVRKWHYEYVNILNAAEIRDTSAVVVDGGNVEDYGLISLRVINTLDQPIRIQFYTDSTRTGGSSTLNVDGKTYTKVVQNVSGVEILTANEIPFLNHLRYIKLRVTATTAPTSGNLTIFLCKKG